MAIASELYYVRFLTRSGMQFAVILNKRIETMLMMIRENKKIY